MTAVLDRALEQAADHLEGVPKGAALVRARSLDELAGPLDLKCALDPTAVRTPALDLLSAELEWLITTPGARLIVSFSPQEGKSESVRHAVLRALQRNPDWRCAIASYAEWLARKGSGAIRDLINENGSDAIDPITGDPLPDRLGLAIHPAHSAEGGWQLKGHRGGVIAKGVGSGLTGAPVDFLVCDDPLKDARDAASKTMRSRLYDWWQTVSETRLAPNAPVIVVATRWHEMDLSGWLIENDDRNEWRVVNIPALSDGKTDDALNRPVGEWMTSARGRTPKQWEAIRARVGERVFAAMYQGRPAPLEGGVFKAQWFDKWRVNEAPAGCLPPTIVVDPADNEGDGDEAGVIVATRHVATGKVYILDDLSAPMTIARWARVACLECVRRDAPTIAFEQSLSRLPKQIRSAWKELHQQASALAHTGNDPAGALARLSRPDDHDDARATIEQALLELTPDDVSAILLRGQSGPRLLKILARGQKQSRMQWAAPEFETGRAVMVGRHSQLEYQARTWQVGQDSPDRVDAAVHAVQLLSGQSTVAAIESTSERIPKSVSRGGRSSGRIPRSVRR